MGSHKALGRFTSSEHGSVLPKDYPFHVVSGIASDKTHIVTVVCIRLQSLA